MVGAIVSAARLIPPVQRGSSLQCSASEEARRKFSSSSSADRTTRMPLPPPPKAALMITGKPHESQKALACAREA